jgi:hypothetical protein
VPYSGKPAKQGRPHLSWRRGGEPHWNPVLFHDQARSRVLLYFKVGWNIKSWETFVTESTDDGGTWSEPVELVPGDHGGRGPVKNKLIVLADGATHSLAWIRVKVALPSRDLVCHTRAWPPERRGTGMTAQALGWHPPAWRRAAGGRSWIAPQTAGRRGIGRRMCWPQRTWV